MKAVFSVVVLLLFTAGANAFRPGPTIIRECPKCHVPIEQKTMASGNTFGARYWSDGKMGAPMLPSYPWLVKCPKCKQLFWIDEAKKLGDTRNGWKGQGKVIPSESEIPTIAEFYRVVEKTKDITKQKYIRHNLWHFANDLYRDGIPDGKYNLSAQEKANMNALSRLLNTKKPEERLLKAEIARELGQFDQCLKLLNAPFVDKEFTDTAAAIKVLAQEKYAPVIEFTMPDYYQERPKAVSAVPTDAENRLFVRALKESGFNIANGMLSRYGVDALLKSDPDKLKESITAGAAKGDESVVAMVLNTAIFDDSVEAVRFLFDNGARINNRSSNTLNTPLVTACLKDRENIVSLLIDRGADINAAVEDDLIPLNIACRERYVSLAKLLLDKGAKLDGRGNDNPLMILCTYTMDWRSDQEEIDRAKKTLEMVKLLIDHGAKVNGIDPLIGTEEYTFKSSPLIEICSTDIKDDDFMSIHHTPEAKTACEAVYLDIIRLFLDNKADINKSDYYGGTALAHACEAGNIGAVKLLLERGADVNKANKEGETPLSIANKLPDKAIAKLLLEHGAKTEAKK